MVTRAPPASAHGNEYAEPSGALMDNPRLELGFLHGFSDAVRDALNQLGMCFWRQPGQHLLRQCAARQPFDDAQAQK
jgi:hypothetical protein